jgi:hypothetical protein
MLWPRFDRWSEAFFTGLTVEEEMSDEVRFHLERRAEDLMVQRGLSQAEAYRHARLEFGSVERYKEEGRRLEVCGCLMNFAQT